MFTTKATKVISLCMAVSIGFSMGLTNAEAAPTTNLTPSGAMSKIASYTSGEANEDGGVAEIIKYNSDNQQFYLVNGQSQRIDIVSLEALQQHGNLNLTAEHQIDVSHMIPSFVPGDVTSIDVDTQHDLLAVAVQAEKYSDNGVILLLDYEGKYVAHYEAGVQPDMITFSADGNYVLSANEGEPREGYSGDMIDPLGTVTIVNISEGASRGSAKTVDFKAYDSQRDALIADNVIIKKNTAPSVDFEPEYIAIAGNQAFVSLQEANAIATIDIPSGQVTSVKGLGFKDHGRAGNELDMYRDGKVQIQTEKQVYGMYMPDGIAAYQSGGKTYLLTANEGDSRDWAGYINEKDIELAATGRDGKDGKAIELTTFDTSDYDGKFEEDATYLFGARSFSIWDTSDMSLVYDSGSDFETITGSLYPKYFNWSNDDDVMDKRSAKKGPEPEDVKVGIIDGKAYAFIGLERIGGTIMYDISNPQAPVFVDYSNTRDFSDKIAGDVAPEGLNFVSAADSPIGLPLLLTANEVSGTVSVAKIDFQAASTPVTRGEMVTMLGQYAQVDGSKHIASSFADVDAAASYAPYVAWASQAKITTGIKAGAFAPDEAITREQAAVMLVRFADAMGYKLADNGEASTIADSSTISAFALDSVERLLKTGTEITKDNKFAPKETVTKAELTKWINSLLK